MLAGLSKSHFKIGYTFHKPSKAVQILQKTLLLWTDLKSYDIKLCILQVFSYGTYLFCRKNRDDTTIVRQYWRKAAPLIAQTRVATINLKNSSSPQH